MNTTDYFNLTLLCELIREDINEMKKYLQV
jgi:hypothetical protein